MKNNRKKKPNLPDTEAELKKLGKRIKTLRIARGFSSHELFAYTHRINRTQYGRYERGEDLRYSSLLRVIHALDMTVGEFFSEGFS